MIRFENVGMRYGANEEVLHDLTFALERGSFHFLTGRSGAGKSSLLKLLYLAHRPSHGTLHLFGQDVTSLDRSALPALRRRIGVVFQDFRLLPHLTVLENVGLPLRIAGMAEARYRSDVVELIDWVGLVGKSKSYPRSLSGGEQQRVAIARAVVAKPDLLLADEPTGNVDDQTGVRLLRLFVELNAIGTTVLLATHNRTLAESLPGGILHIEDGHVSLVKRATPRAEAASAEAGS